MPEKYFFCVPVIVFIIMMTKIITSPLLYATDFRAFYTAGLMVRNGQGSRLGSLSDQLFWQSRFTPGLKAQKNLMAFLNPPFMALIFAPLSFLPYSTAYLIWSVFNLFLAFTFIKLLINQLAPAKHSHVWAFLLTFTSLPFWLVLLQAQMTFLVAIGLILAFDSFRRKKDSTAGFCLSFLLIKPQYFLLPFFTVIFKRRYQALKAASFMTVFFLLISVAITGFNGFGEYLKLITQSANWGDQYTVHPQLMYSWRGILSLFYQTDFFEPIRWQWLTGVAISLILLIKLWQGKWRAQFREFNLQWSGLIIIALFTSWHVNLHDLALLLPTFVLLINLISPARSQKIQFFLALILLAGNLTPWILPQVTRFILNPITLFYLAFFIFIFYSLSASIYPLDKSR